MTEKELKLRQLAVSTMTSWIGYSKANGKYKEIIDLYNTQKPLPVGYTVKYTDAWCATTVSACGVKLGLTGTILPECSCPRMVTLYQKAGRWEENDAYTPNIGDLILYDWQDTGSGDNKGVPDHIGMVCNVTGTTLRIIEGNYQSAVSYRTIKVNAQYIRGYCLPDYAKASVNFDFGKYESTSGTSGSGSGSGIVGGVVSGSVTSVGGKGSTVVISTSGTSTATTTTSTATTSTATKSTATVSASANSSDSSVTVSVKSCKQGDVNDTVGIMQTLLTYLGFKCTADKNFGLATKNALKRYQTAVGLTSDGACGKDTWNAILSGKKTK